MNERIGGFEGRAMRFVQEEAPEVRELRQGRPQEALGIFGDEQIALLEEMEKNPATVEELEKELADRAKGGGADKFSGRFDDDLEYAIELLKAGGNEAASFGTDVVSGLFDALKGKGVWGEDHMKRVIDQLREYPDIVAQFGDLPTLSGEQFKQRLETLSLTSSDAKRVLQARVDLVRQEVQEHEKMFEEVREELKNLLPQLVEWNYVSKEQLEKLLLRLQRTTVTFEDPLVPKVRKKSQGTYSEEGVRMKVTLANGFRRVAFHEFIHAVSGKMLLYEELPNVIKVQEKKVGMRYLKQTGVVLKWLNEALTEWLSAKLHGGPVGSYREEVVELEKLFSSGVGPELFYQAFFEDPDPKTKTNEGKSAPAFGRLLRKIKDVEGQPAGKALKQHERAIEVRKHAPPQGVPKRVLRRPNQTSV